MINCKYTNSIYIRYTTEKEKKEKKEEMEGQAKRKKKEKNFLLCIKILIKYFSPIF